jgi:hypothetical protein
MQKLLELAADPGCVFPAAVLESAIMPKPDDLIDAMRRLAAAEQRFLASEFLAPAVRGGTVQVRIAGIICKLKIRPPDFAGWGIFKPLSHSEAELVRPARLNERRRYLELFPLVRLILGGRQDEEWLALPAHRADTRFRIQGMVPVRLVEEAQLFEIIESRFDGSQFWYGGPDPRANPGTAVFLRHSLDQMVPPDKLDRRGLTAEERAAYAASYQVRFAASEEARRDHEEDRLRRALAHAGGELKDYRERADGYTITYEVDGQRHVSSVSKADLSVQVAGICLSGEDDNFDLQSLVGVLREVQDEGGLVRVGRDNQGMAEEHYWDVHPRPRRRRR